MTSMTSINPSIVTFVVRHIGSVVCWPSTSGKCVTGLLLSDRRKNMMSNRKVIVSVAFLAGITLVKSHIHVNTVAKAFASYSRIKHTSGE